MIIIRSLVALLVAGLLAYSGWVRLPGIDQLELYFYRHSVLGFNAASFLPRLTMASEWLAALVVLLGWQRGRLRQLLALLLLFPALFYGWFALVDGAESCSCFGHLGDFSQGQCALGHFALFFLFVIQRKFPLHGKSLRLVWAVPLCLAVLALPLILHPPDVLVPHHYQNKHSYNIEGLHEAKDSALLPPDFDEGRILLSFYSTGCPMCKLSTQRLAVIFERQDIPLDKQHVIFWGDSVDASGYFSAQHSPDFSYSEWPTEIFLKTVAGRMPLHLMLENGKVKQAMRYRTLDEGDITAFLR